MTLTAAPVAARLRRGRSGTAAAALAAVAVGVACACAAASGVVAQPPPPASLVDTPSSAIFGPVLADLASSVLGPPPGGVRLPLLVRAAWHASGTFDATLGGGDGSSGYRGGSMGGTLRFAEELADGSNAGLAPAVQALEAVRQRHPWLSFGDLVTLAGSAAIRIAGGPVITWRDGRCDAPNASWVPPAGRLPSAHVGNDTGPAFTRTMDAVETMFETRLGLTANETAALISGGHSLGGAATQNSGYAGVWTDIPDTFSNMFTYALVNENFTQVIQPNNLTQFNGTLFGSPIMMLPSDIGLIRDPRWSERIRFYSVLRTEQTRLQPDFKGAWEKLIHNGINDAFPLANFPNCTVRPPAPPPPPPAPSSSSTPPSSVASAASSFTPPFLLLAATAASALVVALFF